MTERQFQTKLLKALRSHPALKDAVIWKHTDARNGGIPDVSVTVNDRTSWFELKVVPNRCTKLQTYYLVRLGRRAFVVQYKDGEMAIFNSWQGYEAEDFRDAVESIIHICLGI